MHKQARNPDYSLIHINNLIYFFWAVGYYRLYGNILTLILSGLSSAGPYTPMVLGHDVL